LFSDQQETNMDLQQFLSRPSGSFSAAFNSRHFNQDLSNEVRGVAGLGLKLFPVSLSAKLAEDPDRLIADATDDILLLQELSAAAQPLWGYRLALGPSGLCVLEAVGRASASLAPDLDDCLTLQARRGDVVYAFFRRPAGTRVMGSTRLESGVRLLGDGQSCIVPPFGGAVWVDPHAEIETLPYALRELLGLEPPDSPPGRAMPAPKSFPRPAPCLPTERLVHRHREVRKGFSNCNQARWNGGYRIYRQR
jgi:hypothetical protein